MISACIEENSDRRQFIKNLFCKNTESLQQAYNISVKNGIFIASIQFIKNLLIM